MELKQLENIVAIAEERSISRAAERLFVSQPALSQQLSKLEVQLGTPLFFRGKQNCSLTQAGEVYVKNAIKILAIRNETYNQIYDLASCRKGSLSIGVSPGRSPFIVSNTFPKLQEKFPNVNVQVFDRHFSEIEEMLLKGELNLGFSLLTDEELRGKLPFSHITLGREDIYVVISRDHPFASRYHYSGNRPSIDLALFKHERFALPTKGGKIRHFADEIFASHGISPSIRYEVFNVPAICAIVKQSNLCTIFPSGFFPADDNLVYYRLTPNRFMDFSICWNSNHYLTSAEQYFIELCQAFHGGNVQL